VTYGGLLAAVCVVAYTAYNTVQQQAVMQQGQHRLVAQHGLVQSVDKRLASRYRDTDGDLLADLPTDVQQMVDPERLVLAHYEGDADDDERVDWPALQARLSEATGKPVDIRPYINSTDDVAAVKAGSIPLVALHSADVPYLVNDAGFVPVAALGTDSGASGNHLVIATGAKSKIKKIDDLRGSKLACTHPYSITGYRAAIAALSQQAGMRPDVDYEIHFSFGQKRSIRGVVEGDFIVAALSAD
jgi:phosphonate transport system substrate-binding protein